MPFKSEKQRRYLFANEPEIARDWADTYGSRIQKNTGGISQLVKSSGNGKRPGYKGGADAATESFAKSYDKAVGNKPGTTKGRPDRDLNVGGGGEGPTFRPSVPDQIEADFAPPSTLTPQQIKKTKQFQEEQAFQKATQTWNKNTNTWEPKKVNFLQKYLYNRFPNNPKWERAYLARLKKAGHYLPAGLQALLEEEPRKLTAAEFNMVKALSPKNAQSFAEYAAEYGGSPGLLYSGNVGNLEKYVETYVKNPDGSFKLNPKTGNKIPATYGYKEKTGDGGGGQQQPNYMNDPAYQAFLRSQQGGTGEVEEEEVVEEGDGVADTVYPYQFYGQPGYPTSATFKSYLARGGRVPAAFGGIMDTETGRRGYFLGSIKKAFKGVAKAAGKVLKSDIGKMALLGAGIYYGGGGRMPFTQAFKSKGFGGFGVDKFFSKTNPLLFSAGKGKNLGTQVFDPLKMAGIVTGIGGLMGTKAPPNETSFTDRGGRLINPLTQEEDTPQGIRTSLNAAIEEAGDDPNKIAAINAAFPFLNLGIPAPYENYAVAKDGGRIGAFEGGIMASVDDPFYRDSEGDRDEHSFRMFNKPYKELNADELEEFREEMMRLMNKFSSATARPRVMAQEGGLMDLGGMEKDYRNNGGFVAIGGEEKADDVPARLSRNEFVFTADAVRGAGGGDIDKGAEIMENVMKNLEQGGKISEETQGNTGAQEMFSVSERIGEVL